MNIKADIADNGLTELFDSVLPDAVLAAALRALEDCNYFCKRDTGELINSAVIEEQGNVCTLKWTAPYAAAQYELPGTRRDKNPNARPGWCGAAYSSSGSSWLQEFSESLHSGGL